MIINKLYATARITALVAAYLGKIYAAIGYRKYPHQRLLAKFSLVHECDIEASHHVGIEEIHIPLIEQQLHVTEGVDMAVEITVAVTEAVNRLLHPVA